MHLLPTSAFFSLAVLVIASPVPQGQKAAAGPLLSIYIAGNNEFYDMPINAVDGGFWVNRRTNISCEDGFPGCGPHDLTLIRVSKEHKGEFKLFSGSGQLSYIDVADGNKLRFTGPKPKAIPKDTVPALGFEVSLNHYNHAINALNQSRNPLT